MTATKTIIQRDDAKISNQILNYKTAISKVNTLLKAFTDAGYNIDDKQANEFCKKNFKIYLKRKSNTYLIVYKRMD